MVRGEQAAAGGRGRCGSSEFPEPPGFNPFRTPDIKREVFNYSPSPGKIFVSASSLSLTVGGQREMRGAVTKVLREANSPGSDKENLGLLSGSCQIAGSQARDRIPNGGTAGGEGNGTPHREEGRVEGRGQGGRQGQALRAAWPGLGQAPQRGSPEAQGHRGGLSLTCAKGSEALCGIGVAGRVEPWPQLEAFHGGADQICAQTPPGPFPSGLLTQVKLLCKGPPQCRADRVLRAAPLGALRVDRSERPGSCVQRPRAAPGECQVEEETEGVAGTELGAGLAGMSEEAEAFLLRVD